MHNIKSFERTVSAFAACGRGDFHPCKKCEWAAYAPLYADEGALDGDYRAGLRKPFVRTKAYTVRSPLVLDAT